MFVLINAFFLFAAPRQSYYPHYRKKEGILLLFYLFLLSITDAVQYYKLLHSLNCLTVFLQRGKTVPEELVRAEDLSKYRQVASHAVSIDFCSIFVVIRGLKQCFDGPKVHSVNMLSLYCLQGLHSASVPGILALDLCPTDTNKVLTGTSMSSNAYLHFVICIYITSHLKTFYFILTPLCSSGGADKNVVVFDKNEEQIVATLKGHTKKVTSVIYHPSQVTFCINQPIFLQ